DRVRLPGRLSDRDERCLRPGGSRQPAKPRGSSPRSTGPRPLRRRTGDPAGDIRSASAPATIVPMKSIDDLDLQGKTVFLRVDYNVPVADGKVADDMRIVETLPTIRRALEKGARLVVASHLGRPKGKPEPSMSLQPIALALAEKLARPVAFASDCIGEEV